MSFPHPLPNWLYFQSLYIHSGRVTGSSHPSKFKSVQHLHLRLWQPHGRAVLHRQHFYGGDVFLSSLHCRFSKVLYIKDVTNSQKAGISLFLLMHTRPMFGLDGHNLGRTLNLKRGFIWVLQKAQSHRQCPGVKK